MVIFAGIVAYFPNGIGKVVESMKDNSMSVVTALGLAIFLVAVVFGISFIEQSYRKIAVHYAKRLVGNRVMSGQSTHLPLKVNMSGVIPAIFGSTLLAVPLSFGGFFGKVESPWFAALGPNQWLHNALFALLVLFFCYFYTSITFKPDDIAENLKKQNAYIPGVRPGTETAEALDMVVTRLTLAGAIYMNLVCLIPQVVTGGFSEQLYVGGTSLLIVVGVALETVRQVSAQLATQKYDSLLFAGGGTTLEPGFGPASERSPT